MNTIVIKDLEFDAVMNVADKTIRLRVRGYNSADGNHVFYTCKSGDLDDFLAGKQVHFKLHPSAMLGWEVEDA